MLTATQVRMARAALKWGVRDLADKADIAPGTVTRIESGKGVHAESMRSVEGVFREAGIEFIEENGGGPGVRLKK